MPIYHTQLFFDNPINVSVQVGDIAYYVSTSLNNPPPPPVGSSPGTTFEIAPSGIREIGIVHLIYEKSIVCRFSCTLTPTNTCLARLPGAGDFIMFSKDNAANMSSVLGYYAEVEMSNDSMEKAKLFAVSADISESSK